MRHKHTLFLLSTAVLVAFSVILVVAVSASEEEDSSNIQNYGDAIVNVEAPWTQTSLLAETAEALASFSPDYFWRVLDMGASSSPNAADVNASSQVAEATAAIQLLPVVVADSEQRRLARSMISSRTYSPSVQAQYKESTALTSALVRKVLLQLYRNEKNKNKKTTSEEDENNNNNNTNSFDMELWSSLEKQLIEHSPIGAAGCGLSKNHEDKSWSTSKPSVVLEWVAAEGLTRKTALVCDPEQLSLFFKNRGGFEKLQILGDESSIIFSQPASDVRPFQLVPHTARAFKESASRHSTDKRDTAVFASSADKKDATTHATAVLHGIVGATATRTLVSLLQRQFRAPQGVPGTVSLSLFYIHRRPAGLPTTPVALQGFGVIMDIKSTEYKAENKDAELLASSGASSSTSQDDDKKKSSSSSSSNNGPSGLDFSLIRARFAEIPGIDTLEQRLANRYRNRFEPFNESSVESWRDIGPRFVSYVTKSQTPLSTLTDTLNSFPTRVSRFIRENVSDVLKQSLGALHSRHGSQPGTVSISVNGRKLAGEHQANLFQLQHMLSGDEALLNRLAMGVLPKEAFEPGAPLDAIKLQGRLLETVAGLRSECKVQQPSKNDVPRFWVDKGDVMWVNDVEADDTYDRWAPSVRALLRQSYGGMPNFPKKNLFHVVVMADPGTDEGLQALQSIIVQGINQETPMRFGMVFYPDIGDAGNGKKTGRDDDDQQQQYKLEVTPDGEMRVKPHGAALLANKINSQKKKKQQQQSGDSDESSLPFPVDGPPTASAAFAAVVYDFYARNEAAPADKKMPIFMLLRFINGVIVTLYQQGGGEQPAPLTMETLSTVYMQAFGASSDSNNGGKLPWSEALWQRVLSDRQRFRRLGLQSQLPAALFNGLLYTDNLGSTVFRGFNREYWGIRQLIADGAINDETPDLYAAVLEKNQAIRRYQPAVYKSYAVQSWHDVASSQELLSSLQWLLPAAGVPAEASFISHVFSGSISNVDGLVSLRNFLEYAATCDKESCGRSRFAVLPTETSQAALVLESVMRAAEQRFTGAEFAFMEKIQFIAKFVSNWVAAVEGSDERLSDKQAEYYAQGAATAAGAGFADSVREIWTHMSRVDTLARKAAILFSDMTTSRSKTTTAAFSASMPLVHSNGRIVHVSAAETGFEVSDYALLEKQERDSRAEHLFTCILRKTQFAELSRIDGEHKLGKLRDEEVTPAFLSQRIFVISSILAADVALNGDRDSSVHDLHDGEPFCFSSGLSGARNRIHAVFDPFMREAPRFASLLKFFSGLMDVQVRACLHVAGADAMQDKMPLKSFYHYVATPDIKIGGDGDALAAPTATMRNLNSNTLFTMGIDEPDSWLVFASKAEADLDNIRLSSTSEEGAGKKKVVRATYSLISIMVTGSCVDDWTRAPPRGLPLVLSPKSVAACGCSAAKNKKKIKSAAAAAGAAAAKKNKKSSHHGNSNNNSSTDTLVMSNLGYFQLKATPGVFELSIQRDSRAEEIYTLDSAQIGPIDEGGSSPSSSSSSSSGKGIIGAEFVAAEEDPDADARKKAVVIVDSFRGTEVDLHVGRRPGMESASLLEEEQKKEGGAAGGKEQEQQKQPEKKSGGGFFGSFFGKKQDDDESQKDIADASTTTSEEEEDPDADVRYTSWPPAFGKKDRAAPPSRPTLNIFSLASGHLYERFLRLMFFTVMRTSHDQHGANTTRIKFWLIENQMSPRFKRLLPKLAAHFGFDYGLVSYKWPYWLRKQSEKQRYVWAYKILFLDVLFPQDVEKVIFVDADQIVNSDLHELYYLDLHGAPVAYTPFCQKNRREETKGFRFWDSGFWNDHLNGQPYHISAIYVVDLQRLRRMGAGDSYRIVYERLSADPNSLANLDQDLPNFAQHQIPIFSLPEHWLWCETWCNDESKKEAKTIDLCNNPKTKAPKLENAKRIIPMWETWDHELTTLEKRLLGEE